MKPDYERAIRAREVEFDLGRAIARKSAVSQGDLKKYEKLSGKDILPTETHQEISKQLFQYTPLSAKFDEQKKAIETQGDKMVEAIGSANKPGNTGNTGNQLVPLSSGITPNIGSYPGSSGTQIPSFRDLKNFYGAQYERLREIRKPSFEINKNTNYKKPSKNIVNQEINPVDMITLMLKTPKESHKTYLDTIKGIRELNKEVIRLRNVQDNTKETFGETNARLVDLHKKAYEGFKDLAHKNGIQIQEGDPEEIDTMLQKKPKIVEVDDPMEGSSQRYVDPEQARKIREMQPRVELESDLKKIKNLEKELEKKILGDEVLKNTPKNVLKKAVKNAVKSGETDIDDLLALAGDEIYREFETPAVSEEEEEEKTQNKFQRS